MEDEAGGQVEVKGALSAQKRVTALVYFIQSDWQSTRINNIKGGFVPIFNKIRKSAGMLLCTSFPPQLLNHLQNSNPF